ncbi:MAG TPA: hypothetical protein EYH45_03365 [Candidatus Caldiarchaeum subterraneum]|uniref:Carbohydrate-binding/sugar hydrolysis domain-containing protein n=1 Tax=Caldiarchaeum subterraneum TaxID=311458 RepID=A0A833A3S1_CALS0|nr:hypothetical protein [Candidatus Caldarchaeum subterraneum]
MSRKTPYFSLITLILILLASSLSSAESTQDRRGLQHIIDEAEPWSVVFIPEGVYYGPAVVDKPLHIVGVNYPLVDGRGLGDVIVVNSSYVVVEGLRIVNTDDWYGSDAAAVKVHEASNVIIRNNIIEDALYGVFLLNTRDTLVENNTITGMGNKPINDRGHGIYLWYSFNVTVRNNKIKGCKDGIYNDHSYNSIVTSNMVTNSRYGIHLMYSDNYTIAGNVIKGNLVGMALMYSLNLLVVDNLVGENRGVVVSEGFFLREAGDVYMLNNTIYGHLIGLDITYTPYPPATTQLYVKNNLIAFNYIGVSIDSESRGYFINNSLIENLQQVELIGPSMPRTIWLGNYWSEYAAGRGIYRVADPLEDLLSRYGLLRAFIYSPAYLTLETMKKAFPADVRVKAVDESPSPKPLHTLENTHSMEALWLLAAFTLTAAPVSAVILVSRGGSRVRRGG